MIRRPVFTDPSSADVTVDEHEFDSLLRAEDEAGRRRAAGPRELFVR
jgi:hypothetical protein